MHNQVNKGTITMKKNILIVDNEEIQQKTLSPTLQKEGYIVNLAEDGEKALSMMKETKYDVVVLDIRIAGVNSDGNTEFLNKIVKEHPKTEIILTTGFADFTTAIEYLNKGARDYLIKPIHPTELVARLKRLLHERQLQNSFDELQHNFSSVVLNRLFSPISSTTNIMDHVSRGRSGPVSKEQAYLLAYARKIGDKTINLIRYLTGLSQMNDESALPERKPTDLVYIIENICTRYTILARPKELKINNKISKPLKQVNCEPDGIVQALNNILDYSLEHSLSGGTITISTGLNSPSNGDTHEETVTITIKDSGVGVPDAGLLHILEEKGDIIGKLSSTMKRSEIGLAISKNIIEDHGGTFNMEFDAGSGNIFVVTLPATD